MTAFSAAVSAMFRDPHMAADINYREDGIAPGITVRHIRRTPDAELNFSQARVLTETVVFNVMTSQVAKPKPGDVFVSGTEFYRVTGQPVRDELRLTWQIEVMAIA